MEADHDGVVSGTVWLRERERERERESGTVWLSKLHVRILFFVVG